jgi:predicted negative regulator of RcsB-dependent stress response
MAIDDLLDEHEQSERVREWLRRNGAGLIGGVALGLAAIFGWKWWDAQRANQRMDAANAYQAAIDAVDASDAKAADKIKALPPGSYADLATLALAKSQVLAGQRDAALATLRGIRSSDPAITEIVNLRIARLLLDAGKADEALKLAGQGDSPAALELRGDAELALGQRDRARDAYAKALPKLDVGSPRRGLLELKLTEVGGTPPQPEAKS